MNTYQVTLEVKPQPDDPDGVRRVRMALKRLLRTFGLRCTKVEPVTKTVNTALAPMAPRPTFPIDLEPSTAANPASDNALGVIGERGVLRDPHTQLRNQEPVTGASSRLRQRKGAAQ
jgi:hypothetical protein